jgi:DNA-binding transcriptional LysR family regulator
MKRGRSASRTCLHPAPYQWSAPSRCIFDRAGIKNKSEFKQAIRRSDTLEPSASALVNRLLARGKFRHVQLLLLLAELGSVQRTAQAIGMTQSSVTQTLAVLEALLEVKLFDRHARGVRPTAICAGLLPIARQLAQRIADSADVIVAQRGRDGGVIRMLGSLAAIHGLLVDVLPDFVDQHPHINIEVREAEGEDQLLAITRGEVDLVVCRRPAVTPEGWEFHAVREDRYAIVCRAEHPLARSKSITPATLARHEWLLIPAGYAARGHFDELVARFPRPPKTYPVMAYSATMMWWLARRRDLLMLVARQMARPLLELGEFVEIPLHGEHAMRSLGILQPSIGMRDAAERFSAFLRARSGVEEIADPRGSKRAHRAPLTSQRKSSRGPAHKSE